MTTEERILNIQLLKTKIVELKSELLKEKSKQYYIENIDIYKERSKQYYIENIDIYKERSKQYAIEHPEQVSVVKKKCRNAKVGHYKEIVKNWKDENKVKVLTKGFERNDRLQKELLEYSKQYAIEHPEQVSVSKRKWQNNPDNLSKIRVVNESNHLLRIGDITKVDCSCGQESKYMYHNDYIDPQNIIWCCSKCFYIKTKERNRTKKLNAILTIEKI